MKPFFFSSGAVLFSVVACVGGLPIIVNQPTNQNLLPGSNITLSITATGASDYQWRFNGTNLAGATRSDLQIQNAQPAHSGYYLAIAENETGWVPSGTLVPFSNVGNVSAQASYQESASQVYSGPITNGTARVVAGPELDQMQPLAPTTPVTNGYFRYSGNLLPLGLVSAPNLNPGQQVYYRVDISYPTPWGTVTQQSTVLRLAAGGAPATGLRFPLWPEWPEPWYANASTPSQVRVPGESITFSNFFVGYGDFGVPTLQWRKDGRPITDPVDFAGPDSWMYLSDQCTLSLTNLQASDCGIYDAVVLGNNWLVGPKISLGIQLTDGQGILRSPRILGTNFVCDLDGIAGRSYLIQASANLHDWGNVLTLTNTAGLVSFTNDISPLGGRFYRASLVQ